MLRVLMTLAVLLVLPACKETVPKEALQLSHESLQQRQVQTRRFDTIDENKIVVAGAQVLQDLGFNLDESETKLGLIVGSKERDAVEAGQVVGAVFMALLGANMPIDKNQKIRASLVTYPTGDKKVAARVTFQRTVWNTHDQISRIEALDDPKLYQEFFEKLSQSTFLTANEI